MFCSGTWTSSHSLRMSAQISCLRRAPTTLTQRWYRRGQLPCYPEPRSWQCSSARLIGLTPGTRWHHHRHTHVQSIVRVDRFFGAVEIIFLIIVCVCLYRWPQHQRAHQDHLALNNTFQAVVTADPSAPRDLLALQRHCLSPGAYATHLERWLQHYQPSQVRCYRQLVTNEENSNSNFFFLSTQNKNLNKTRQVPNHLTDLLMNKLYQIMQAHNMLIKGMNTDHCQQPAWMKEQRANKNNPTLSCCSWREKKNPSIPPLGPVI